MGPELAVAILGPIVASGISLIVWVSKRNADRLDGCFSTLTRIERTMDQMHIDMVKDYVTKEELKEHVMEGREVTTKIMSDMAEIKDMAWNTRMDMLHLLNVKKERHGHSTPQS